MPVERRDPYMAVLEEASETKGPGANDGHDYCPRPDRGSSLSCHDNPEPATNDDDRADGADGRHL